MAELQPDRGMSEEELHPGDIDPRQSTILFWPTLKV